MERPINRGLAPLIVLSDMVQRREIRAADEDWTGTTSGARRRKLQNRLNQRAYGEYWGVPYYEIRLSCNLLTTWMDIQREEELPDGSLQPRIQTRAADRATVLRQQTMRRMRWN